MSSDFETNNPLSRSSIQFEFFFPVVFFVPAGLFFFVKEIVAHDKIIHFGSHKTAECVIGSADDRFASDIERGVDDDSESGFLSECVNELPVSGICLFADTLNSC